jgi:hypothetical protein
MSKRTNDQASTSRGGPSGDAANPAKRPNRSRLPVCCSPNCGGKHACWFHPPAGWPTAGHVGPCHHLVHNNAPHWCHGHAAYTLEEYTRWDDSRLGQARALTEKGYNITDYAAKPPRVAKPFDFAVYDIKKPIDGTCADDILAYDEHREATRPYSQAVINGRPHQEVLAENAELKAKNMTLAQMMAEMQEKYDTSFAQLNARLAAMSAPSPKLEDVVMVEEDETTTALATLAKLVAESLPPS